MKSFPAYISWEGGMQHDGFVSLPEPVKSQGCSIAVEGFCIGPVPDEPIYVGFLELTSPFDRRKKVWIGIEMPQTSLLSTGNYLHWLKRETVVDQVIRSEFVSRRTQSFVSIEKEFIEKGYEVPHVKQVEDMTSLVVPKQSDCRLFFNYMIDIKHVSSEKEHVYNLSNAKDWFKPLSHPVFGLKLQVNNSSGESKIIKYTKDVDELDHQVDSLVFTSFETKDIDKVRVQVVDPAGQALQTIGDCFLHIKTQ